MNKSFDKRLAEIIARPTKERRISGLQLLGLKCLSGSWYQKQVITALKAEGYFK